MPICSGDDDRIFVMRALTDVAHKWRRIGDALGLSTSTLEQIGQGPPDEALSTMVCKWLAMSYNIERFPKPSWDALVKAVAEPAGADNRKVAEEMARHHPREPEDVDGMLEGGKEGGREGQPTSFGTYRSSSNFSALFNYFQFQLV